MSKQSQHPDTLLLHHGFRKDPETRAVAVPIYMSASFEFDSADQAEQLFRREAEGSIYGRAGGKTNHVFEDRMSALEGGVAAISVGWSSDTPSSTV